MAERIDAGRFLDRAPVVFLALFLQPARFGGAPEPFERAAEHACRNAAHSVAVPAIVDFGVAYRRLMFDVRAASGRHVEERAAISVVAPPQEIGSGSWRAVVVK